MRATAEYGGVALGVECAFPAPTHRHDQPLTRLEVMIRRARPRRRSDLLLLRRRIRRSFR